MVEQPDITYLLSLRVISSRIHSRSLLLLTSFNSFPQRNYFYSPRPPSTGPSPHPLPHCVSLTLSVNLRRIVLSLCQRNQSSDRQVGSSVCSPTDSSIVEFFDLATADSDGKVIRDLQDRVGEPNVDRPLRAR
jgi:hypothetical protein